LGGGASSEVVPRDFQTLTRARAARALELAGEYPASGQAFAFLAQIAKLQAGVAPGAPLDSLPGLIALTFAQAPPALAEAARDLDRDSCQDAMEDYLLGRDVASPRSFFARVLLQPVRFGRQPRSTESPSSCPCCLHPPQAGVLRELAHGQALWLSCSLCFYEWEHPRSRCIGCGETAPQKVAYYRADELPHIQVMTCDECRQYIHLIDSEREPRALADIDEVAALPLDVWAVERGFSKIQPNLVGI
jgi:FdhE protein